jgi:hypothetical protein
MIRPEFRTILMDQRGAAVILWSFFMISVVIYIVIARNVLADPKYAAGLWFAENARIVLWFLAVVDLGYYLWWKQRYLTRQSILGGAKRSKIFRALEGHKGQIEERAATVISTYVTRKIVLFAILEALAVYGLVLAIVGRFLSDQYLLSALSLVLLTLEFPAEKSLEALVREIEQAA